MLQKQTRTLRAAWAAALAVLLFTIPAQAADAAYLISDRSDPSRAIFTITHATDQGSAGMLLLRENNDTYALPVYHAESGCTVTLQGQAAQLRVFPVHLSGSEGQVDWNSELSPSIGQMQVTLANGVRTIAASEFKNYVNQLTGAYIYESGAGFRLNSPGYYLVNHSDGGLLPSSVIVQIPGTGIAEPSVPLSSIENEAGDLLSSDLAGLFGPTAAAVSTQAEQNSAPVLVNGKTVHFDAYTIRENANDVNGYTYFKLRDLAAALSGTEKQFEVTWDNATGTVALVSGHPYTLAGGELTPGQTGTRTAALTNSLILKDGISINPTAYLIGQNNYFKLRDIAQLFDFSTTWDNDAMCIRIDTTQGYTP